MFSKVLILAFVAVASATLNAGLYGAGLGLTGGIPVYRTSANYGGLVAANGWGYGANLGRVAGLGALRAGPIGYGLGSGALIAGGIVAPAISTYGAGLGLGYKAAGLGLARGLSVSQAGPVNAAVQTISRTVDYTPVPYSGEPAVVQDIDVPPQEAPLRINFQSKSSPLALTQQHIPAEPGQVQVTQSEDEPQQVVHNVVRPVYQQVNEVVKPYRTLTQTVEPVVEQTHTNIAQGEGVRLTGLTSGVVGGSGVLAASGLGLAAPAVAKVGGYGLGLGYGLNAGLYGSKIVGSGLGLGYGLGYGRGLGYGSSLYGAGLYGTGLAKSYGVGYGLGSYGLGSYGLGSGLGYGLSGLSTKILRY